MLIADRYGLAGHLHGLLFSFRHLPVFKPESSRLNENKFEFHRRASQ